MCAPFEGRRFGIRKPVAIGIRELNRLLNHFGRRLRRYQWRRSAIGRGVYAPE